VKQKLNEIYFWHGYLKSFLFYLKIYFLLKNYVIIIKENSSEVNHSGIRR